MSLPPPQKTPPRYEPGGGRLIAVAALIVMMALAGMVWSFFSRFNAPTEAPTVNPRFLPPSARPAAVDTQPGAASPAPSFQTDKK